MQVLAIIVQILPFTTKSVINVIPCRKRGGDKMKKIKENLVKLMYSLTLVIATVAANSTCFFRFYQEEMDSQLDSLKKYHEE